jgi:hypothetical protein
VQCAEAGMDGSTLALRLTLLYAQTSSIGDRT